MRGHTTDEILQHRLLCARLRAARERAGLSQEAAARALDRPQSYIAKTERGERRVDLVEVQAFLALYKLDASTLFSPFTREERAELRRMAAEQRAREAEWERLGP